MKSLPIDVDWDNKESPTPIEVEWDCQKCGKPKSGTDKCECPPIKKGEVMDIAWQLLKMPYHGTDEETAKKILRGGTRAFRDKRHTFRGQPAKFWMADTAEEAMRYARIKATRATMRDNDYREIGFSRPTVLHISDEGVDSVPHQTQGHEGNFMGKLTTHNHPHRIDPKHISIHDQGPKPDIPEPFDWAQDDVDTKVGRANEDARDQKIKDYKSSVWDWGRDRE